MTSAHDSSLVRCVRPRLLWKTGILNITPTASAQDDAERALACKPPPEIRDAVDTPLVPPLPFVCGGPWGPQELWPSTPLVFDGPRGSHELGPPPLLVCGGHLEEQHLEPPAVPVCRDRWGEEEEARAFQEAADEDVEAAADDSLCVRRVRPRLLWKTNVLNKRPAVSAKDIAERARACIPPPEGSMEVDATLIPPSLVFGCHWETPERGAPPHVVCGCPGVSHEVEPPPPLVCGGPLGAQQLEHPAAAAFGAHREEEEEEAPQLQAAMRSTQAADEYDDIASDATGTDYGEDFEDYPSDVTETSDAEDDEDDVFDVTEAGYEEDGWMPYIRVPTQVVRWSIDNGFLLTDPLRQAPQPVVEIPFQGQGFYIL